MACGILRCTLILLDPVNGAQQAGSWAVRETFVAVIIDNIPMIYPLCLRIVRQVDDTLASHYARRTKLSGGGGYYSKDSKDSASNGNSNSNSSYAMHDRKEKKFKSVHPLSMRNATLSESSESIVRADTVKDGRGISIVKESTVMVTPTRKPDEDIKNHDVLHTAGTGYAVTCNYTQHDVLRGSRRNSAQWR